MYSFFSFFLNQFFILDQQQNKKNGKDQFKQKF